MNNSDITSYIIRGYSNALRSNNLSPLNSCMAGDSDSNLNIIRANSREEIDKIERDKRVEIRRVELMNLIHSRANKIFAGTSKKTQSVKKDMSTQTTREDHELTLFSSAASSATSFSSPNSPKAGSLALSYPEESTQSSCLSAHSSPSCYYISNTSGEHASPLSVITTTTTTTTSSKGDTSSPPFQSITPTINAVIRSTLPSSVTSHVSSTTKCVYRSSRMSPGDSMTYSSSRESLTMKFNKNETTDAIENQNRASSNECNNCEHVKKKPLSAQDFFRKYKSY